MRKYVKGTNGSPAELLFECETRIGMILFHGMNDFEAAYKHYKKLEQHPARAGHGIHTDYRCAELYVRIADSALACPTRKFDEVEKYTCLVMAYPYLSMKDREMYRKFYGLYREAGRLFIVAFSNNLEKLTSIEIYPSHPKL